MLLLLLLNAAPKQRRPHLIATHRKNQACLVETHPLPRR